MIALVRSCLQMARARLQIAAALLLCLAACGPAVPPGESSAPDTPAARYETEIRWTSYGIPHVRANDRGSLGYGFAYATARDGFCTIAREILMVNGDLARHFGAIDDNRASDLFHRAVLDDQRIRQFRSRQTDHGSTFFDGYVAGYNRYLRDHRSRLPAACLAAPWVREINADDLARLTLGVSIRYGLGRFQREMANAAPPGQAVADLSTDFDLPPWIGSNAIALGKATTASGRGLLLGNPHYPWQGSSRLHLIHTTIPGELDVMGVSLYSSNRIAIGFNQDVAWTLTASPALRSTLYALELQPGHATRYRYGDTFREMTRIDLALPVRHADGSLHTETHPVYMTHFGPVVVSDQLPWTETRAFAIRDVNLLNDQMAATYEALNRARSIDEVENAISLQGVAWTSTIAADRHGTAYYADISVVPNVDASLLARCRITVDGIPDRTLVLDGAKPECAWHDDPRSAVPGAIPAAEMPRLRRDDFVVNAGDSHWLTNPAEPREGYSPMIGAERTTRSLRTRAGFALLQEVLALDVKPGPEALQSLLFSHRNHGAEGLLDDVLSLCRGPIEPVLLDTGTVDITPACQALAAWDRTETAESRGSHVWRECWREFLRLAADIDDPFRHPFDPDDPLDTPRGLDTANPAVRASLRQALAIAQQRLLTLGIALDAPLGSIQFTVSGGERIPVPGGEGWAGMWSTISAELGPQGYTPILGGNSYIQIVGWNADGSIDARGLVAYSQSDDPASPHHADQTRLYAAGQLIRLPFREEEIAADPNLVTIRLRE